MFIYLEILWTKLYAQSLSSGQDVWLYMHSVNLQQNLANTGR